MPVKKAAPLGDSQPNVNLSVKPSIHKRKPRSGRPKKLAAKKNPQETKVSLISSFKKSNITLFEATFAKQIFGLEFFEDVNPLSRKWQSGRLDQLPVPNI